MAKFAFLTSGPTKTVARFQQLVKRYAFRLKNHNIVAYYAIWIWGLFEIILCATVLLTRKHEYTENFLFDLCPITDPTCSHFIVKALIGRVVVSVLLLIGNITVSTRRMLQEESRKTVFLQYRESYRACEWACTSCMCVRAREQLSVRFFKQRRFFIGVGYIKQRQIFDVVALFRGNIIRMMSIHFDTLLAKC